MQHISENIAEKLLASSATVSTAESCTGGLIAASLIDAPGISGAFREGYITYSNEAKRKLLGVSARTLDTYGAVSPNTAEEMATGCARQAHSDYAVISTGIAGPDGGTPEKPVGLVYLACYAKGEVYVEKHLFEGGRRAVREQAASCALDLLYRHL